MYTKSASKVRTSDALQGTHYVNLTIMAIYIYIYILSTLPNSFLLQHKLPPHQTIPVFKTAKLV